LSHGWGRHSRLLVPALVAVVVAFAQGGAGAPSAGAKSLIPAVAGPTTTAAPPPPPKAWILVDADTGNVIDAGNDRTPLPPASLTKVITALTASSLAPDTPITVSARSAAAPADKLFMKPGQVWTADELLHTLLISSANDAAVSLAEEVGGTVEGFQPIFARTALGLGMVDHPVLVDPAGLDGPDGVDGGNLVSARDLSMAGRALLSVPSLATIVATPVYYFDGPDAVHHRLTNHNKLFLVTYPGAIGMKTGYTKRAGACVMAAARVGGRTLLAVVLNSSNPTGAAKALLDKGFATSVSAETTVDQLPAVNLDALNPATSLPGPSDGPVTPTGPASPVPVRAAAVARAPISGPSWPVLIAGAAVALLLGLYALVSASRPRRTRGAGNRRR
jgi:D-alanyl-D-alanine carboxypeptidase